MLQISYRGANGYNIPYRYAGEGDETRRVMIESGSPPCTRALPPRGETRTPLSMVLMNTHVLTEIVMPAERLIAAREGARKG